jgi:transcriptional regulator with XRE-family HTH domain
MATHKKHGIGARVRQLREERGWSQVELASHLPGVKQQSVDQLEQGKVSRPRFLPELATAFSTSVQWLLTGEGAKNQKKTLSDTALDIELLRDVVAAVEHVVGQSKTKIDNKHRAEMIAVLYDMMLGEDKANAEKLNEKASNIISYSTFIKRG